MKKIKKICIIDDDPIHIYVTKDAIENTDLCEEVLEYENGKVAYDALVEMNNSNEKLPNLILLDLNMPIWDGWDFLEEFSKLELKEKVVVFINTSSNDPADERKAKEYSLVNSLIIKPISIDNLITEIAKVNDL